jgi:hypothetical protein
MPSRIARPEALAHREVIDALSDVPPLVVTLLNGAGSLQEYRS